MNPNDILLPLFENFILIRLMQYELTEKNRKQSMLFLLLYTGMAFIVDTYYQQWYLMIALVAIVVFAYYNFTENITKKVYVATKLFVLNLIFNIAVISVIMIVFSDFELLRANNIMFFLITFFSKSVFYFLYICIRKLWKNRQHSLLLRPNIINIFIYVFILLSLLFAYSNFIRGDLDAQTYVLMIISIILISLLISTSYTSNLYRYYMKKIMVCNESLDITLHKGQDEIEMLKSFQHDYNNHLKSLLSLIETGKIDMAEAYIFRLLDETKFDIPMITSNPVINLALSYYEELTKNQEIRFRYYFFDYLEFIDYFDLTVILYNLLDNAIEAQGNVMKEKYIYLTVSNLDSATIIFIENSKAVRKDLDSETMLLQNSKGLTRVEQVLEKYDCVVDVESGEKRLKYKIIFNNG